ncbi:MAG: hypothetical protein ACE5HV_02395 [Acidobacteriota bacterium]
MTIAIIPAVGARPVAVAVLALLVLCMVLFRSLTVEVAEKVVELRFGPGLIRKSFRVASIRQASVVRNRWYYGWGIRWTPHGWLFNISGLDAVQLKMVCGRRYRIGTDQPKELLAAIESARADVS